ncbi:photosystem II complex extrinsic protein PsbU [Gloeocapsa sp. PCC 73106]|uniref:photosystem II complex extrinsic protein PsbU n=1 Tax=Gloeocapsa sp. PCC 73106 TaxID=102232 RepID=UPI0002ACD1AA|nr:photosystem II complex extrinsic protein PsbU [Gloeocapsa sp. PCC 73106]ELR96714.1 Photosystem II 12 kDa extrinsic protein (PsbU) [Gloeocapsa sp. PCC 73106]
MKKLISALVLVIMCCSLLSFWGYSPAIAAEVDMRNPADAVLGSDYGKKVDLNNANVRLFRKYRGYYPTLAALIVNNAPYEQVDDVLKIPGLSGRQKELLSEHMTEFTVTPQADVFNEGGDRYNPGIY